MRRRRLWNWWGLRSSPDVVLRVVADARDADDCVGRGSGAGAEGNGTMALRALARALVKYQDRDGLWHEVVTAPASYAEFSATAMIGRSFLLGIRNGWLDDKEFRASVNVAWKAVNARRHGFPVRPGHEPLLVPRSDRIGNRRRREPRPILLTFLHIWHHFWPMHPQSRHNGDGRHLATAGNFLGLVASGALFNLERFHFFRSCRGGS